MYPHERSLVKRLADKPFAIIGVNSDKDREKLKGTIEEENITWRSFWNGPEGTSGPISTRWNVTGWPTIYVIDHEGVIRYKNVRGDDLDVAIDTLLAEMADPAPEPAPGPGAQPVSQAGDDDPEEQLQELIDEFDDAMNAFMELYRAAPDDQARQKLYEERYPDAADHAEGFLDFAAEYGGTEHAARALIWVVQKVQGEVRREATKILLVDHRASESMVQLCQAVQDDGDPAMTEAVRGLLTTSPHAKVRGQACFTLAYHAKRSAQQSAGERREKLMAEFEELMERICVEFADLPHYNGTLGEAAESELFELRNLQIGQVAPEIEGEDLDGVPFKLSDYRGKVVVLDFWGHW